MSSNGATVSNFKVLIAGFAAFAMFFGSGNLVFPLKMGSETQSNWVFSSLGLAVTGVIVPFLGLAALTCLKGSQDHFFRWLGKVGAWIVPFLILLLIGPFGVIPRCITVGFGAWQSFVPTTPIWAFALGCVAIIWLATFGNGKIVDVIGKYFTPVKLGALALVIGGSLYFALSSASSIVPSSTTPMGAFKAGFFEGYNTMDLMAAIFFGVSLVQYFKTSGSDKIPFKPTLSAMALGMSLLMVVYMALVYLGAAYSTQVSHLPEPQILPHIAHIALGEASDYLISFTLVVSCLTTAVALTSVSVDFLCAKIPFLNGKRQLTLMLCIIITFVIALTDFRGIMSFMAPILQVMYPFIIAMALLNIIVYTYKSLKSNNELKKEKKAA
ncbi:branched-chain amino acid transport system II carrier protein [Silvanigrella sp.]|jgi:LIVCS family branched-chain amino acid:cation transporter|uniref:branched-chain amino acid transport system II carrier protein n=1 Tax=Silvanigrella sp. TaxID=2024976 RepID=UPI0037C58B57